MTNPQALYQEVILEHNKKPRNFALLEAPTHQAEGVNPLCGDHIFLTLGVEGERIAAIGFSGDSCAICKASTSMMTTSVKGKTVAEAEDLVSAFRAMTTGELTGDEAKTRLGRLTVFSGIAQLPSRVKCAVLPWHTLHSAISHQATASTEGPDDPAPGS